MQWENLTADEFAAAAHATGVCVVPMGVLERHGNHLPVGTDVFLAHRLACLAAEREPAVVFPAYPFGKVFEAACFPGAIALKPTLLIDLALNVFDEIARNGFLKILLFNAHGGNTHLLSFLVQCNISEEMPYTLYLPKDFVPADRVAEHDLICPIPPHEHAGEIETGLAMALFPELVREASVAGQRARPLGRMDHLPALFTAVNWYADFPEHHAGDSERATLETGRQLVELYVDSLAKHIADVKADETAPALRREIGERRTQFIRR